MKINNIFPISIVSFTVEDHIVKNTTALVDKFILDTDMMYPAAPGELLTTFYKDKNFLGKLDDTDLLNYINKISREYLNLLGYDYKCFIEVTSWLQLNQPGSFFVRHDHYGALISGVMYLRMPDASGDILFHTPLEARRVTNTFFEKIKKEDNEYNFSHVKHTPVVGEIVLFESWLQHTVQQNLSNENRISIGFNIWAGPDDKS
jgi:uncharacterized protein (TIGR02466 family)